MKKKNILSLLILSGLFLFGFAAQAAPIPCTETAIKGAISSASPGAVIEVQAGTCSFSTWITINKNISLIGAPNEGTIIKGRGFLIPNGTDGVRVSGFYFSDPQYTLNLDNPAIKIGVSRGDVVKNFRIDHCKFFGYAGGILTAGRLNGVIDSNKFWANMTEGVRVSGHDEAAWAEDTNLGASNFLFIEDNEFDTKGFYRGTTYGSSHFIYMNYGGRTVIRYNTFKETPGPIVKSSDGVSHQTGFNNDWIDSHGYCHDTNGRGNRAFEIYKNTLIPTVKDCCRGLFLRGGTGVVWNNTFDKTLDSFNYNGAADIFLVEYRASRWAGTLASCSKTCSTAQWCSTGEKEPCCDQIGTGKDKSLPGTQTKEPVYLWDNVDIVKGSDGTVIKTTAASVRVDPGSASYIEEGEDYFLKAKDGYNPYIYPHPLRGTDTAAPSIPTGLMVK